MERPRPPSRFPHHSPAAVAGHSIRGLVPLSRQPMAPIREGKMIWLCGEPACGKGFQIKSGLRRHHKAVHEGRRDWICEEPGCGKAFREKKNMVVHQVTVHEGRRDWLCSEAGCGSAFGRSWHLSDHRQTVHEGRRDFMCTASGCTSAFGRKGHLLAHQESVHEGRRDWKCDAHCGRIFTARRSLLRHKRRSACQSVAPSQHATLPPRKRKRDDNAAPTPSTSSGGESVLGGDGAPPLCGLLPNKRRPPTSLMARSQRAGLFGNEGVPHFIPRRRKVFSGGSNAAATRFSVPPPAPPVFEVTRPLSAFNSPAADVALPTPRDRRMSFNAQDISTQRSRSVLQMGSPTMHEQKLPVPNSSIALKTPRMLSHAYAQTPASDPAAGSAADPHHSTVLHPQGIAYVNARFSAPTGGKYSDRGGLHGEELNSGGRGRADALSMAQEKWGDVGRKLVQPSENEIGPGDEKTRESGGSHSGDQHRQHRGGYGGSHNQGQDGLLQYENIIGGSGSELRGRGGQYARRGLFYRGVNFQDTGWSDGVRDRPQAGISVRSNAFPQQVEQQALQYDHFGELQNSGSLGRVYSPLHCRQQASAEERKSGTGTPVCGAASLSVSNIEKADTAVPAHPPLPNFSTAFKPLLLTITRAQRSLTNSI